MDESTVLEMKLIGSRIREERQRQNMSQAVLSEKANVSLPQISDIENGKSNMLLSTFIRILNGLQVSADEIIRPDTPNVKVLYEQEYAKVLSDCTPAEIEAIMKIVKEVKQTLRSNRDSGHY